jgi:hypothetical protein
MSQSCWLHAAWRREGRGTYVRLDATLRRESLDVSVCVCVCLTVLEQAAPLLYRAVCVATTIQGLFASRMIAVFSLRPPPNGRGLGLIGVKVQRDAAAD